MILFIPFHYSPQLLSESLKYQNDTMIPDTLSNRKNCTLHFTKNYPEEKKA